MISIAGYSISSKIHEGARSLVFRGKRNKDNQPVILKVLSREYSPPEEVARFKREYEITSHLNVEDVIAVYGLESYKNRLAMILEDIHGDSLDHILLSRKFNVVEFLSLAIRISAIIGKIHQQQVMHKDINPSNILWTPEQDQLKIIDFGIATRFSREQSEHPASHRLEGSLAYMAPEQTGRMNRAVDYRTDFYSLGVTFYEMLVGFLPFQTTDTMELIHCHLAKIPAPPHEINQSIPKPMSDIIMRLMAKAADERYQSISGLLSDLRKCREQFQFTGQIQYVTIGQDDVLDTFQIPQKLYGRTQQIDDVLAEFERVKQGESRFILVSGYSGSGKSTLIHEIHTPIIERHGYFIAGRFERFKKNVQYSALLQTFQKLIQQILTEDEQHLAQWKERLLAALGKYGQILIEMIPELEFITGSQPKPALLSPIESRKRLQSVLQDFIRVFGTEEHPLVLFWDNIQWADTASLKFLQGLLMNPDNQHLLIIGAYRDHEVPAEHPLHSILKSLQEHDKPVKEIELTSLSLAELSHFLADTLHGNKETLFPLAKIVLEKTGGNPFAVKEFLKSIYAEDLLTFDVQCGCWQWNLEQIKGMVMTENVVEFMATKIQKLPADTQYILQCAACIGNRFDLFMLAAVMEKSEAATAAEIECAVHEGFILPSDESYQYMKFFNAVELKEFAPHVLYNFAHNRFQEAALKFLSKKEQGRFHLKIGRHLLQSKSLQKTEEEDITEIVDHFNLGAELIEIEDEKIELIQLNLMSGKQAKMSADYPSALRYISQGMALLELESWTRHYALTFDIYKERAEVEYLSGKFDQSEQRIHQIIEHTQTPLEQAVVYKLLIIQYTLRTRYSDAITVGKNALNLLNVPLPERDLESVLDQEQIEIRQLLDTQDMASLLTPEAMTDPVKKIAMQLLDTMIPAALQTNPLLYRLISARLMILSLKDGYVPESASGYAQYGILLGTMQKEYKTGYEFGTLAVKLSEYFRDPVQTCKTTLALASSLTCWVKHLQFTHRFEHEAYHTAMDAGEFQFAGLSLMHRIMNLFYEGTNLEQIQENIPEFLEFSNSTHNQYATEIIVGCQLIIHNLRGLSSDKQSFDTADLTEEHYRATCLEHHCIIARTVHQIMKAQVLYLYGFPEEALEYIQKAERQVDFISGFIISAALNVYYSLCLTALYTEVSEDRQQRYHEQLQHNQQQLQCWSENCPENFRHLYLLVQAEQARLANDTSLAMRLYQQAIKTAETQEFIHHAALAHELAARFYLEQDFSEFAELHLRKAYYAYNTWGSTRKVVDLAETYPQFLTTIPEKFQEPQPVVTTSNTTHIMLNAEVDGLSVLDLNTVMKASQAISGEIVLESLLKQMMRIVLENAGAQKGWLILKKQEQWVIEAAGVVDREDVDVLQATPVGSVGAMQTSPVPSTIIHYVIRTGEPVVLHNAAREGKFTYDPHIVKHQVKSVLCIPLMKRGKLNGIIYLENNLTTGAFTSDRLKMLNMLSLQMVVSLENAVLYQQLNEALEHQVKLANNQVELTNAYSRFVPDELLSLLGKKSIVDVQLGEQVEKEITVMFCDIRGFTQLSEQLSPQENFNFINSYLYHMSPIIREHHGFIDKYIGDAIMSLFPTNADDALRAAIAMLEKLRIYNQGRKRAGYRTIQIGIGLNTGSLMLGTVGDQHRMDGTVISDAVNLAARIESMTKTYGVSLLISETTYFQLENSSDYAIRIIDQVQAKGKSEPVTVFEVFNADPPHIIESKLKTLVLFRQGFKLYHRTKFAEAQALFNDVLEADSEDKIKQISEAKELFEEILHVNPHDKVARIYLQRCEHVLKYGVLEEWSNVWAWVETLKKQ